MPFMADETTQETPTTSEETAIETVNLYAETFCRCKHE